MPAPHRRATLAALAAALVAATLAGCDYVAQRKLVAGQHSEHDVRALMGVPTLVWDRADGGKRGHLARPPLDRQCRANNFRRRRQ